MNRMAPNRAQARLVRTPIQELKLVAMIEDKTPADDTAFSRCGWFDSSLELAAGLQVIEFAELLPDGLPFEVLS